MKKPEIDGDKLKSGIRRAMWMFLALLFVATGLGVGIYSFFQANNTAKNNTSSTSTNQTQAPTCTNDASIQFNAPTDGSKIAGAQLSDFTPIAHVASLSCTDVKVGSSGQVVQSSSSITANYTGALTATGVIFQSSLDNNGQPFTTALASVIPGWQQGLLGMRAGGERRLEIPASLAYGSQAQSGIPANSDLVFDITVLAVQ